MKTVTFVTLALFASLFVNHCFAQDNLKGSRSSSVVMYNAVVANVRPDSTKPVTRPAAKPAADVVVNMEMIESFRRSYDQIEVSPYAALLGSARADDMTMALLIMKSLKDRGADNTQQVQAIDETQNSKALVTVNTTKGVNTNRTLVQ